MRKPIRSLILCLGCLVALVSCGPGGQDRRTPLTAADSASMKLETLNRTISEHPSDPAPYNQRARYYLLERQFDLALKDIHKAISLDSRNPAYFITLSDIYLLMGRPGNSKEALESALKADPSHTEALAKLAKLYLIMKEYPNCYATVKTLLDVDNANAPGYYIRALALLEQGDTLRAVDDLKKAVDYNQQYYEAFVQLGELYAMRKDKLAELYLNNALNVHPTSREALYMLGMHYQETGNFEKAIATYQRLSKVDTTSREAYYNTGYIYLVYLRDFPKAVSFFSEALKKDPTYAEAWYNRGYAQELAGNYKQAYADYEQALKVHVNYDKAIEGLNRLDRLTR
ncbi:MAG TPA: tetratricopeptide repeat protein [Bacteroidales bacterium]|nr:tetratricopeptide repeat protein [Bacteroidales bacterium]